MTITANLIPVTSSMLQAVGYDEANKLLYVQFNNGKVYKYLDVPANEYEAMKQSESIGRYLNGVIKPNYQAEQVEM